TLDGRHKFEPRIGFNWQPTHTLKVAGGLGLFAGGLSDVFISNNYSNSGAPQGINGSGAAITSVDIVRLANGSCIDRSTGTVNPTWNGASICADALSNVNGATIPSDVLNYAAHNTSVLANTYTNFLDPKFKLPAQWKYNITLSWHPDFTKLGLGDGWTFRTDVLFSDTQSGVRWVDLRAQPLVVNGVVQTTPDGRTRYGGTLNTANGAVQPGSNYDMELTNTKRGISRVFAIGATKSWKDFDVSASYTHTRVHDIAGALSSSTVSSSYSVPTDDANSGGAYGRSAFEISSIVRANINFHHKFFGDNETRLGINWELRSGQPYSITMNDYTTNSTNGRSGVFGTVLNTTSQLLYVPNFANCSGLTCGNVTFDSASTMANLQKLVNGTKLYNYQGAIAPKNLMTGPSYNKIDLNFAQQIPVPRLGRGKLTALFSIENFLNMLNRDWGTYQDIGATAVVKVACVAVGGNACGQYLYSSYSSPKAQAYIKPSLYAIRAGVRFDF
ncbi:MAG TPA: hypothetical protein VFF94_10140, partial [Novosphingobium sp.]|nr:hypothetical protein [Novosphingobium sp.]